ncbi:integrase zinc binding domain-containing protein, partial [Klebsiella pneumoniae]|uniref:integrase zinc binding domain-containing protein n=1 Tax=Klebsiella pneumoniae TaxID=573 RepID=UPI00405538B5
MILYINNINNLEKLEELITEYLKPNTKYGIICENKGILNKEYEILFNNFCNVIRNKFRNIKISRYKKQNLDITEIDEQKDIISNYHLGKTYHRGINETYEHIRKTYYWPTMRRDITELT